MNRQAVLLLCAASLVSLVQGCVLELDVLDGAVDFGESDESDPDAEDDGPSETSTSSSTTDAEDDGPSETSSSTTDAEDDGTSESSSSTTDAEDDGPSETSSSTTDAEDDGTSESSSSTTDAEDEGPAESSSSTTDAEDDAPADCINIQLEYEALVEMTECSEDAECKIIDGHCGVGLGGCYYAVNVGVDETELDLFAEIWSDGGCTQGVCDCPEPPAFAICDVGTCVGAD